MKKIVLDLQTYKAKKTFNFSRVLSFFPWTSYHAISGLIKTLVFVFIILLTEPQKFTFHSSSRKNTKKQNAKYKLMVDFAKLLKSHVDCFSWPQKFVWSATVLFSS